MTTRRIIQRGTHVPQPISDVDESSLTMNKVPSKPYVNRCCADFRIPTTKELRQYFPNSRWEYHHHDPAMYALANDVLTRLGYGHLIQPGHPRISERDRKAFMVEIAMMLATALAYGLLAPQRLGGDPRNAIATQLTAYIKRIYRFAGGHGVQLHTMKLGKKKYGILIDDIYDNGFINDYAEMCVKFYERRLARNACDPI